MYNIDLSENETIIYNNDESKVIKENDSINVSIVITNNRLIILEDTNKKSSIHNVLTMTKAMSFMPNKEIIFEIELSKIVDVITEDKTKIILPNNQYIFVLDNNIEHIIKNR